RAADDRPTFEDEWLEPSLSKIARDYQAVVAGADDDDVVAFHCRELIATDLHGLTRIRKKAEYLVLICVDPCKSVANASLRIFQNLHRRIPSTRPHDSTARMRS